MSCSCCGGGVDIVLPSTGGGSGTPGGADGDIQYNDGGTFGGFGNFNDSTNVVTIPGNLDFVGDTSSFPALKRSSADLKLRLADDSAPTNFYINAITLQNSDASAGFTIQDRPAAPGHQCSFISNAAVSGAGAVLNVFSGPSTISDKNISQLSLWTVNLNIEVRDIYGSVLSST